MSIAIQCPNPACGTSAAVPDAVAGRTVKCKRCGTPFVAKPTLSGETTDTHPAGTTLDPFPSFPATFGRYTVLKLLGKGGMGSVYLAEDTQLHRKVALKLPAFAPGESPRRAERFVREARSAAGLSHPNICTVYDAGQIDGRPFLSMAYLNGRTLDDAIDPDAPLPPARAASIARQVAHALAHAHAQGIIHRDLKPANVMLTAAGDPVVMDFGLAKRVTDSDAEEAKLTRDGAVMGTPTYMSPEQVRGETVGPAADVYALGVLLFEMLAGRPPYTGPLGVVMGQILHAPVPAVREFRPDADPVLEGLCNKALAKDPAARFPTMAAFAAALDAYLAAPATPVTAAPSDFNFDDEAQKPVRRRATATEVEDEPSPRKKAPTRPSSRRGLIVAAAGGLAALIVGVALFLTVRTKHGDVVIELSDPSAKVEVKVDGDRVELVGLDKPLTLTAGEHGLTVTSPDFETVTQSFTVKKGERQVVKVSLRPRPAVAKGPEPKVKGPEPKGVTPPIETGPEPKGQTPPTETIPVPKSPAVAGGDGFVPLFNGKDLTGWVGANDGPTPALWAVKDGAVAVSSTGPGVNKNLWTAEDYGDFELEVEYRTTGNSGIYFRSRALAAQFPQALEVSIIPPNSGRPVTRATCGGLYDVAAPTQDAARAGDWNVLRLTARGSRVTTVLNGVATLDVDLDRWTVAGQNPDGTKNMYTSPVKDLPRAGRIGLQAHNGNVEFRAVRIRRLDAGAAPPKAADGFTPLFNGKDLTGWRITGDRAAWRVERGELVVDGGNQAQSNDRRGWLFTEKDYADFLLRFEFAVETYGNSGVGVRCVGDDRQLEVQILDDRHPSNKGLADNKRTGAIQSIALDKALPDLDRGRWYKMEVQCQGRRVKVTIDGTVTTDLDLDGPRTQGRTEPGVKSPAGPIGLQKWTGVVRFRNIEVRDLTAAPK
jgi:serine/threonine protein kinase